MESSQRQWERLLVRRQGVDVARVAVAGAIFGLATVVARGDDPGRFQINIFRLVNDLPTAAGPPLLGIMQFGALLAVGVCAAVALLGRRVRAAQALLVAGLSAWALARFLQGVINESPPEVRLRGVHLHGAVTPAHSFPASHAAVAAALATAASPYLSRRTRHLVWAAVFVVAIARVYNGAHFPVDVIGGLALGWGIGSAVHLGLGRPRGTPSPEWIANVLADAGRPVRDVWRTRSTEVAAAAYHAVDDGGQELHITFVGRDLPEADWLYRAGRILAFREVEDEVAASTPAHRVAHESYVTLLAQRAGVAVASVVGAVDSNSAAMIVTSWVAGNPLVPGAPCVDAAVLERVWKEVAALHEAGLSHGALRGDHIIVGPNGPVLVSFALGRDGASASDRAKDIAELLVSVALVSDVRTAVEGAIAALGTAAVTAALPLLQPLVLSSSSRRRLRQVPTLLSELRTEVARITISSAPPIQAPVRLAVRNLFPLALLGVAVYVLLPQVATAGTTARAVGAFQWIWLPAMVLAATATYVMSSLALITATGRPLALGRTTAAQLAGAFTNRLAPAGLGGMATEVRYLQAAGLRRGDAAGSVVLKSVAGFAVHAAALAAVLVFAGSSHQHFGIRAPDVPERWEALVLFAVALAVVGLVLAAIRFRRVWLSPLRQVYPQLRALQAQPARALRLLGASGGITAAYVLALVAAVEAVGGAPLVPVVAVYLGASAVAAAAPTPGGLGAIEAGLVAGLTSVGMQPAEAVTAVLIFRLVTYWGPVLPGAAAFWLLRRGGAI